MLAFGLRPYRPCQLVQPGPPPKVTARVAPDEITQPSLRSPVAQSAIPVWVTVALAFLAPVAALVGVVVGAVMQRRTTRLQLEAARVRDRELWAREDRHRFTEQKRVLYAEFVSVCVRVSERATSITSETFRNESKRSQEPRELLDGEGNAWFEDTLVEAERLLASVNLVAAKDVFVAAEKLRSPLHHVWWSLRAGRLSDVEIHLDRIGTAFDDLTLQMRHDLDLKA